MSSSNDSLSRRHVRWGFFAELERLLRPPATHVRVMPNFDSTMHGDAGNPVRPLLVSGMESAPDTSAAARDLAMVETLLDRCWQEIDSAALNVKLADVVRLLEFRSKLRPSVDAEQTFWAMINQMRHEELGNPGETPSTEAAATDTGSDPAEEEEVT